MATADQRIHLAALMAWTVKRNVLIHYSQARPYFFRGWHEQRLADHFSAGLGVDLDCSSGVTMLCMMGGLADPNGRGYDGYGFTGTLLSNLPHHQNPGDVDVGALVIFGPGTGQHAAMVYTPGSDPVLWSHGGEAGPIFLRLSAEQRFHPPPTTFLSIAHL